MPGSALELPTRYTPKQIAALKRVKEEDILRQAPVTPVSPKSDDAEPQGVWEQQLDPSQDPEYTGTPVPRLPSVHDPVGVQNVARDIEPSPEGEAHITIAENGVPTPSAMRLPSCNRKVKILLGMKHVHVCKLIAR